MEDVTQILRRIESGDLVAAQSLLPLVYDELRRLAGRKMSKESPDHTLSATGLVHEVYLRLVDTEQPSDWSGRKHFFAAAAEAMRRILIESARRKAAIKRGGNLERQEYDEAEIAAPADQFDVLALDEALERLAADDPEAAELVKLRFFAGLTIPETAALLGISPRKANTLWAYAKAWLYAEIGDL